MTRCPDRARTQHIDRGEREADDVGFERAGVPLTGPVDGRRPRSSFTNS